MREQFKRVVSMRAIRTIQRSFRGLEERVCQSVLREIMVGVGELGGGTGLLPTPTREGEYLLEALSLHHTLGCPGM